jgi:hypothetical protein
LFDREKGKSISKKVNLGDIIPSKTETSVILQKPLIKDGAEQLIDRTETLIYGNVKALIPLVRETLKIEPDTVNPQKSNFLRGELQHLREDLIFGILTYD